MNEENKLIDETLESFFEQFGSLDIYTKIVLEEFFKEIMKWRIKFLYIWLEEIKKELKLYLIFPIKPKYTQQKLAI